MFSSLIDIGDARTLALDSLPSYRCPGRIVGVGAPVHRADCVIAEADVGLYGLSSDNLLVFWFFYRPPGYNPTLLRAGLDGAGRANRSWRVRPEGGLRSDAGAG